MGNAATLQARHPGNLNAVRSGVYSRTGRVLAPRAQEIAESLMDAPHVAGIDSVAAEEIGSLLALIEAIDRDLAERGVTSRGGGQARSLLDLRLRASGRLERWLAQFGATPRSRAEWAETMARGDLATEIARLRAEGAGGG